MPLAQHGLKSGEISCGTGRGPSPVPLHASLGTIFVPSINTRSLSILDNGRISICLRFMLFSPSFPASPSFLWFRVFPLSEGVPLSGSFGGARPGLCGLRVLVGDLAGREPLRADVSLGRVTTSPPLAVGSPVGRWRVIRRHGLDRASLNSYGGAPVPRPQTEAVVEDETFGGRLN